jgi:hypothetical protein
MDILIFSSWLNQIASQKGRPFIRAHTSRPDNDVARCGAWARSAGRISIAPFTI